MMKNDKTESELFAQIKQSLDNYQEAYIPGSWENFVQQRNAKKRALFLRVAAGIAACLLLGFAGYNFIPTGKVQQMETQEAQVSQVKPTPAELATPPASAAIAATGRSASEVKNTLVARSGSKVISVPAKRFFPARAEHPVQLQVLAATANDSVQVVPATSATPENRAVKNSSDSTRIAKDTIPAKSGFVNPIQLATEENQNRATLHKRKVRLGVNFSPGISTAQASGSFNYTGGLSADILLFSNFQLSTGVQVENQNVLEKTQGVVSSSAAPSNQTRTKMINLDVPVNITWKFRSEKTRAYYVSAGLSSLVYLNQQNKNTTYSQDLVPVSSLVAGEEVKSYNVVNQVSVTENSVTPDQAFDFAGRVNIMVGFETRLSDRLFIHIEPFAKIPASGVAPKILNHTSTGINFKISF